MSSVVAIGRMMKILDGLITDYRGGAVPAAPVGLVGHASCSAAVLVAKYLARDSHWAVGSSSARLLPDSFPGLGFAHLEYLWLDPAAFAHLFRLGRDGRLRRRPAQPR